MAAVAVHTALHSPPAAADSKGIAAAGIVDADKSMDDHSRRGMDRLVVVVADMKQHCHTRTHCTLLTRQIVHSIAAVVRIEVAAIVAALGTVVEPAAAADTTSSVDYMMKSQLDRQSSSWSKVHSTYVQTRD